MKFPVKIVICLCSLLAVPLTAQAAPAELSASEIGAAGAVLMDAKTGRVLWGKNEHEPLPMASTTKIMTCLYAIEHASLDDTVTVSPRAAAAPEVRLGLAAGEKIRLGDLLYPLMLESANDAAVAIAEHVGGSVEEFCRRMTAEARETGARDTAFETPNGLDQGNHHSTAYDMALITRRALANETFRRVINTADKTIESDRRSYPLINKNRLLREYPGANGVKTGFTGKAGQCFVGSATRDGRTLISVVLASGWGDRGKQRKWTDTKALLDYGFGNFSYVTVAQAGKHVARTPVARSKTKEVGLAFGESLEMMLSAGEKEQIRIQLFMPGGVKAPVAAGQPLGLARVYDGGRLAASIPLLAEAGAARHDWKTSLEKTLRGWFSQGLDEGGQLVLPDF